MNYEKMSKAELIKALQSLSALSKPSRSGNGQQHDSGRQLQIKQKELERQYQELREAQQKLEAEIAERQRTIEALRESDERFRLAFENNAIGMALVGIDSVLLKVNKAFCSMLGYTERELTTRALMDIVHPEDTEKDSQYAQLLLKGEISSYKSEKRFIHKNKEILWTELTATVIRDKAGKALYGLSMIENITKRKRAEEENRLLLTITKAISEAEDLDAALGVALAKVCAFTSWEYGEAWAPSRNERVLECSSNWYSNSEDLEHFRRLSETLVFTRNTSLEGRVWVSQKPEWIKDVSTAAKQLFSRAEIAKKVGLKAGLGIPIVANDNVLAVLVFFMSESREEDKRLVELISAVGAQLGAAMRRKKVEAELRESEERYRTLVETLPNAILVELDDQLVYVNPTGLRLLGYDSLGELEGYGLEDLFDETTGNEIKKIKEAINIEAEKDKPAKGEPESAELGNLAAEGKIIQKDDKAIEVDMIFTATTYLGKPALRVVANDITETKKLREAAQRMERLAALGKFSTTIAHEIRNPLGALSLNFEFLSSRMEIAAAYQKKFQHIGQGIARIRRIIDGILDYARPMELALKPTNIHHVLDSSLHAVKPDLDEAGIVIEKNYDAQHPEVLIDPHQMVTVFANLFSNAKEAMSPGGRLMIQTLGRNKALEVQIKDTGKGIAPENLENIFNPFFTTKGEGVGLGLAVVSRILEEHRVPIAVESKAGGGTKFTVKFPQTL